MKNIEREIKKIFPKSTKYISIVLGIIAIIISLIFYFQEMGVGKYIKEEYGNDVYNIFVEQKLLEKTKIKKDKGQKYLWYIAEDSGKLEIVKEDNKKHKYSIFLISNTSEDKIQVYPPLEIEKQSKDRLYIVSKVSDGDTIKIKYNDKMETLRLIGVDTPESVHLDKKKNIPEGKIASDYTKDRLEGKEIKLEFDVQARDKYGRLLAYVYIDGKMYNEELLEKGYARLATYPPNVKYVDNFTKIQSKAIKSKKGFWKNNIWEDK